MYVTATGLSGSSAWKELCVGMLGWRFEILGLSVSGLLFPICASHQVFV